MSWDSGFSKVTKYGNMSEEEFFNIERYLGWRDSVFNRNSYPTYRDYFEACYGDEDYPDVPKAHLTGLIEAKEKHKDEFGDISYSQDIYWWGSWDAKRILDDFICEHLRPVDPEGSRYIGITKEFIEKSLDWVNEKLKEHKPIPVSLIHAFKYTEDGINLIECDGIEVENSNHFIRIDSETEIYIPPKDFDSTDLYILESFKDCLIKLSLLDLDNTLVWYWRSW